MKYLFLLFISIVEAKCVFWFTGLPCSGKTTIAEQICERSPEFVHLDGDVLRKTLCADLGFSLQDRQKNLERIAHFALKKLENAETVLVTTISPLEVHRERVREMIESAGVDFFVVYVKADLETCIQRDVKGMYAKALRGEIKNFTGISSPYEEPSNSDLVFDTDCESLEAIVERFEHYVVASIGPSIGEI